MGRLVYIDAQEPCPLRLGDRTVWICRCGLSGNGPLCDGSHSRAGKEPENELCLYGPPCAKFLAQTSMNLAEVALAIHDKGVG